MDTTRDTGPARVQSKLGEALIDALGITAREFSILGDDTLRAYVELSHGENNERLYDNRGALIASIVVAPREFDFRTIISDTQPFPFFISVFEDGRVTWEMPANPYTAGGEAQSNVWPYPPVLSVTGRAVADNS